MRVLAAEGTALTVDCGDLGWIDVDDGPALEKAERWALQPCSRTTGVSACERLNSMGSA